jgi:regulator of cell morphogenesis and NO signaling
MSAIHILDDRAKVNRDYDILGRQEKKKRKFPIGDFETWKIENLIDHIIDKHHKLSRQNAVIIYDLSQKVVYQDGKNDPQTKQIGSSMFLFLHDFLNNLRIEEEILFPNIRHLVIKNAQSGKGMYRTFSLLREAIKLATEGHRSTADYLRFFRELTNDYSTPSDSSVSHRALLEKLNAFEADFVLHEYIETKILFPKALEYRGKPLPILNHL